MDYGNMIRLAWRITWRHRFLWILGLFVPGAIGGWSAGSGGRGGSSPNVTIDGGQPTGLPPEAARLLVDAGQWLTANWVWIMSALGLILLFGLAMLVVSIIAQGGMVHATVALAEGQPMTFGLAWRRGVGLAWRFVGLWLIMAGVGVLLALVSGATIATLAVAVSTASEPRPIMMALAALLGLAMLLVVVPLAIGLSVVTAFAQRVMAVEDCGPISGLRQGWRVMWGHLGTSALAWLITVGLSIGAGLAIGLGVLVTLAVFGGLGLGLYLAIGFSAGLIAYGVLALIGVIAVGWLLTAIANTFFWTYWTLVYLRLTEQQPPAALALAA